MTITVTRATRTRKRPGTRVHGYAIHVQHGRDLPIQKLPTIWASDTPDEWATVIANEQVSYARIVRSGRTLHTYQRAEVQRA